MHWHFLAPSTAADIYLFFLVVLSNLLQIPNRAIA